ncbi:MAG TPA: PAS domain S-box protein [Bacteroidales bacterium]|nr:PAS domain S-box protein [Bacteroidales bacterium]
MKKKSVKSDLVFDASPVAMSLFSLKHNKLFDVNPAWLKLFSFKNKDEVTGGNLYCQEISKYDTGKFKATMSASDGHSIDLFITCSLIEIDETEFRLSVYEDITEFRHAEESLRNSELRFRRIVEASNEGIWQSDAEMNTVYVNDRMASMLGYSVNEMIGKNVLDFMDDEGKILLLKKTGGTDEKGKSYSHKYLKKDGTYLHALVNVTPLYNSRGKLEGTIGMLSDISSRMDVERALRKTRRKLDLALENGKIGIWEWNLKTGEVVIDDRIERIFGTTGKQKVSTITDFESLIHEEDIMHLKEAIVNSLRINQPLETIFRTKPGSTNTNYISLKALISKDRKGQPLMLTGVCFDVTEMKKDAEQGLIRLTEELLRSNNDLKQFAYVVSHDLQEPLRMISSFVQLLKQRYYNKLDDEGREYIRYAVDGSKRMYELLNGLLAYSRIQTKAREFSTVNMNDVLVKVESNLSLAIRETGCIIGSTGLPIVSADESQMLQLMQNLIENAIKFSRHSPRISISCSKESGYHVFSVEDEGIGIEKQYFGKIFEIFQRLHRQEEYKGTGIGLAICKRIIERHSGSIWLTSVPGSGTTFYFSLPDK